MGLFFLTGLIALWRAGRGMVGLLLAALGRATLSAVRGALLGALRTLPRQMRSPLPPPAAEGGWEGWGIHGHALEAQEYAAARAHLVSRVQALVARPRVAA